MNLFKKAGFFEQGSRRDRFGLSWPSERPQRRTQRLQPSPMDNPHSTLR